MSDSLLKIPQVAERLGLSTNTVYTMAQAGELPAFKVGSVWRVRPQALEEWIRDTERASQSTTPSAEE